MLEVEGSLLQGLQHQGLPYVEELALVLASFEFPAIYELSPVPCIYVVKIKKHILKTYVMNRSLHVTGSDRRMNSQSAFSSCS